MPYTPQAFESKWQKAWQSANAFKTGTDKTKPKKFILDMFPYPSAAGLHVGHPLGYTATDIVARYYRHKGYNVLHPMGWDAFGLPAEQHAIETGEHPAKLTYANISNFKRQLTQIGFSYDWDREVATCDPSYYKWTQKIFTVLYEKGLAYQAEVAVNWCPALKTVLANEEVIDGKSERGDHPVYRVPMRQWMLKITDYADRLLADLDKLDWPENIKEIQRNWIGKSTGARIAFSIEGTSEKLEVFTTRPDTIWLSRQNTRCLKSLQPQIAKLQSQRTEKRQVAKAIAIAPNSTKKKPANSQAVMSRIPSRRRKFLFTSAIMS